MKVIPPLPITDAILTSSTVAEPAAGEAAWNAATNYALGAVVARTTSHRLYTNLIAGVDATLPENAPNRWQDSGPTNKWAMFDTLRNSSTVAATSMSIVLAPGKRVDSIALMGLVGETVTITVTSGGVTVYSASINLILRNTTSWYKYFFGAFAYAGSGVRFDLPPYTDAIITVTISRASGNVSCGALVIGQSVDVGRVLTQAKSEADNYSTVDRDAFGKAKLVPRRSVPKAEMSIYTTPDRVDELRDLRSTLNAVPAVYSGLDDNAADPNFEALLILGIYKQFSITLENGITNVQLTTEEI